MKYSAYAILKRINIIFLIISLVVVGGIVFSQEIKGMNLDWIRKGELFMRVYQDTVEDNPYEDNQAFCAWFRLDNKINLKDWNALLNVNVEARGKAFLGEDTEEDIDILLREAYLELRRESFNLGLGRQIITWGKLDNVVILDRISPQDYTSFVLFDKQQRKQATPMVTYTYYGQDLQFDIAFLPIFKPSCVRFFGADWAAFGHIIQMIEEGAYPEATKNLVRNIRIEKKDRFTEDVFKNSQIGFRLKSRFEDIDWAIYYMYIYNRIPTLREKTTKGNTLKQFLYIPTQANLNAWVASNPSDEDLVLEREHSRTHITGLDFETVVGQLGLRGELGLFLDMPYLKSDFSYTTKDTLSFGIGIDHTTPGNLYLNFQFIEDIVFDYEELFSQEEYSHQLTSTLTKDFFRGKLTFNLDSTYRLSYHDWMVNPQLTYQFGKGLEACLGGFIFEGGSTTLFGRYSTKDLIYVEVKYQF